MASFLFNWKLVEAESRILKQPSEQRERQFSGLVGTLVDRTFKINNTWASFHLEINNLTETLRRGPYPCGFKIDFQFRLCSACYIGETDTHFATRLREHLSDKHSHIFKYLRGSENCCPLCSEDCFKILDSASTSFQLKIKEAMHILFEQPSLR